MGACRAANELVDGGMVCVKPVEILGIKMPEYGYTEEKCWNPFQSQDLGVLIQFKNYVEVISNNADPYTYNQFIQALALHAIMDLIEHQGKWYGYDEEGFRFICERLINRFKLIQFNDFSNAVAEIRDRLEELQLINTMIKDICIEKGIIAPPTPITPREMQKLFSDLSSITKRKGLGSIFVIVSGWGPVPAGAPAIRKIYSLLSRGLCIELKIMVGTYRWDYKSLEVLHEGYYCDLYTLKKDLEELVRSIS